MAKVKLNPVLERIRGKVGDLVFRRYEDQVVIAQKADQADHAATPGQAAHRERFRLAALYGKAVIADPAAKAVYENAAHARGKPVFALMVGDFLNAPVIEEIDLSAYTGRVDEPISIRASDDFEVADVKVAIRDTGGTALEQGTASPLNGTWRYTSKSALPAGQPVVIEVTASDRPGNKTVKTQERS